MTTIVYYDGKRMSLTDCYVSDRWAKFSARIIQDRGGRCVACGTREGLAVYCLDVGRIHLERPADMLVACSRDWKRLYRGYGRRKNRRMTLSQFSMWWLWENSTQYRRGLRRQAASTGIDLERFNQDRRARAMKGVGR